MQPDKIIVAVCERGQHVQVQRPGDPSISRYCSACDTRPGRQPGTRSLEMVPRTFVAVDALRSQGCEETAARALNLEAGRQRGPLADEDDWDTLTEQERAGWRLCARAAMRAVTGTPHDTSEVSLLCGPARNIERTIQQAWRNGWGSALLTIQTANEMVQDDRSRRMLTKQEKAFNSIVRNLIEEWVKVIDPLLEDCLAVVRDDGRMAVGPEDGGR